MLPYTAFNLQKAMPKGAPLRVYGLCGDAHLQHSVLQTLTGALLDADARDFNMDTLDGESATISDVMSRCGNLPFLAERRVVVVSRAERLEGMHRVSKKEDSDGNDDESTTSSTRSSKSASPAKRLSEGLKNLAPMTVLILCRTPETPELGAKSSAARCVNAIVDKVFDDGKLGLIIDCTIDTKNSGMVTMIVENEAAQRRILLERGAASHLVERVGVDIAHLLNELDKCALRAGNSAITIRIIDEMTQRAPHEVIFNLMDVIAQKNGARAIAMLRELVGNGQAPEAILAITIGQLRKMLIARFLMDNNLGVSPSSVERLPPHLRAQMPMEAKNLPPSFPRMADQLANQARQFSSAQIENALEQVFAVDLAMKGIEGDGGGQDAKDNSYLALELFIAQLCARKNDSQGKAATSSTRPSTRSFAR